jgi:hypothetical protein
MDPSSPAPDRTVMGDLIDVSEVAVRFAVPGVELWAARRTALVQLSFALDGNTFDLDAHVLSGRIIDDGRREVVVRFDDPPTALQELLTAR